MKDRDLNEIVFDGYFENMDEHLFKKLNKKRAEKGKGPIGKKLVDKVKKVAKKLGLDDAAVLPLVPFKKAMKKHLAKKGIKAKSNKMIDVADAFYKDAIQSKIPGRNLEEHIDPVTITVIVSAIVKFFKEMKERKAEGKADADEEELSQDLDDGVEETADLDEDEIEEEVTSPTPPKKSGNKKSLNTSDDDGSGGGSGSGSSSNTTLILVVVVIAIIAVVGAGE